MASAATISSIWWHTGGRHAGGRDLTVNGDHERGVAVGGEQRLLLLRQRGDGHGLARVAMVRVSGSARTGPGRAPG